MLHCNSVSVSLCNRRGGIQQESMWLQLLLLLPALLLLLQLLSREFSWRSSDFVTFVDMWMTDWWWMFDTKVGGSLVKRRRWGKGECGSGERLSESVISSLCMSLPIFFQPLFQHCSVCRGLPLIYKWSYSPPRPFFPHFSVKCLLANSGNVCVGFLFCFSFRNTCQLFLESLGWCLLSLPSQKARATVPFKMMLDLGCWLAILPAGFSRFYHSKPCFLPSKIARLWFAYILAFGQFCCCCCCWHMRTVQDSHLKRWDN